MLKDELKAFKDPVYFATHFLVPKKGKVSKLWPWQENTLREFYSGDYQELILCLGMRSGKTFFTSLVVLYELFKLLQINDIESYYDLPPGQELYIMNIATSESQALRTVFAQTKAKIENSWWFQKQNYSMKYGEFFFPDINTYIISEHSNSSSLVGKTCKLVAIDELARFKDTESSSSAASVYYSVTRSVKQFGNEGKVVVTSSPLFEDDFFYGHLVKEGMDLPNTLVKILPTWECNPKITFESLIPEKKKNPEAFMRDFGAVPSKAVESYFKNWDKVLECVDESRSHPLDENGNLKKEFRPEPNTKYIIAGDPAYRNDAFGFAMVHKTQKGRIIVDLVHRLEPEDNEINPVQVREFLISLARRFPIEMVVFDTWMYPETISELKQRGLTIAQNIVSLEEYDTLKELVYTKKISLYEHEELLKELEGLELVKGSRIDHPRYGSKDIADALANAVFFCYKSIPYKRPQWLLVE